MRTARLFVWRTPPRWMYWVAASLAPVAIPIGAVLCVAISVVLSDVPDRREPRA